MRAGTSSSPYLCLVTCLPLLSLSLEHLRTFESSFYLLQKDSEVWHLLSALVELLRGESISRIILGSSLQSIKSIFHLRPISIVESMTFSLKSNRVCHCRREEPLVAMRAKMARSPAIESRIFPDVFILVKKGLGEALSQGTIRFWHSSLIWARSRKAEQRSKVNLRPLESLLLGINSRMKRDQPEQTIESWYLRFHIWLWGPSLLLPKLRSP